MEVESGGIANNYQIDSMAVQKMAYALYQLIETSDLAKGLVKHSCFADSAFQQFAAGLSHFWPSNADKFNVVPACLQGSYQTCAVGVGTWLGGTDKDTILVLLVRHKRIC
jgi:hypothetical protein